MAEPLTLRQWLAQALWRANYAAHRLTSMLDRDTFAEAELRDVENELEAASAHMADAIVELRLSNSDAPTEPDRSAGASPAARSDHKAPGVPLDGSPMP